MKNKLLITTALVAVLSTTNAQAYTVTTDGSLNEAIQAELDKDGVLNEEINLKSEKYNTSLTLKNIIIKATNDGGVVLRKGSEITLGDGTSSIDISSTSTGGTALEVVANASKIYVNAKDVKLNSEKAGEAGIWAQNSTQEETDESKLSRVEVHADTIDISAKSNGVVAMSQGRVVLEGNTTIKAEDAISTRGYAKTEINKSGEHTLKMDGNINFTYHEGSSGTPVDATVDVTLVGAESYWKGNTIVSWNTKPDASKLKVSDATIRLIDGATWTATTITDNDVTENGSYYTALNNLIINKGTVNIEDTSRGISVDKIEAKDATFNGGALKVNGTMTISGNLELNNNIVGSNTVEFKEGSSLKAELEKTATKTTIEASTIKGSTTMVLENGSEGGQIKFTGDQTGFKFADNALFDISEDSGVYTFSKKSSDEVAAAVGATGNQASTITAVTSGNTTNATFNTIANNINSLMQSGNPADVKTALDASTALAPEVAPAVQSASTETTNQVFGAVGTRLSGGSISTGSEGMSSGDDIFERVAVWVQGMFNKSKLDDTSKAKGFDSDSNGVAFGIEKNVTNETKLGIGYAYTNTDIDGFMRKTDVDTHTAIVYGEYKPSRWFVNGIATYGWSDYSENKNVAGTGVKADYDVDTFGLQAMTGYDMNIKGFGVTPEAGLRYVHIKQDSYKDSTDQKVSGNDSDILTGVIGAKVSKNFELSNDINLKPEARVAATYDLTNDNVNSVVTLANGSAYAVKGKALDRFGMEFGAGVTTEVNDNVELSLGYEGKFRQDYQDHTGLINAKYKF